MRPYLAIITDSFRAAFASRVLWFVLAAIVLLLVALAPLGYQEVFRTRFEVSDINSAERMTALLAEALERDGPSAAGRVAQALPESMRESILQAAQSGEDLPGSGRYADALNQLIADDSTWYDPALWQPLRFGELSSLESRDAGSLDERMRERRNRLRIEAALPGAFRARPGHVIQLTYAYAELPGELPLRRQQLVDLINSTILPTLLNNLFGIAAVFIAILVTAPIIPEMLQPGSLHLLLSKPLSRSALYLSKFLGGCAFVLLCETLLVTGLWLIAGWRFDIWNHRLFLCIPVFVFLFAVYYSVSALAALRWRSAIVSVVLTILFWFACFLTGIAGELFDGLVRGPDRVHGLAAIEGTVVAATDGGELKVLREQTSAYETVLASGFGQQRRILGPLRLEDGRLVAAQAPLNPFSPFEVDNASLLVFSPEEDWQPRPGRTLPQATTRMLVVSDGIVTATRTGLWFAPAGSLALAPEVADREPAESGGGLFAGITRLLRGGSEGFQDVLPDGIAMTTPSDVAVARPSDDLVVYSAGTLVWLNRDASPDGPRWSLGKRIRVPGDPSLETRVAATADHVILAQSDDQPIRVYRARSLEMVGEIPVEKDEVIERLLSSPEGTHLLALSADQHLRRLELDGEPRWSAPDYPRQGSIDAAGWGSDGRLWIAHDIDRLAAVDPGSAQVSERRSPERSWWRRIDAWVMTPLRVVVPQTGEIGETVVAVITGSSSLDLEVPGQPRRIQLDIARPLATCAAFTTLMLLAGCWYIQRQDF